MLKKEEIPRVRDGIVIDHIPAGKVFEVLEALDVSGEHKEKEVWIFMNVLSRKLGKKDMIKIHSATMKPEHAAARIKPVLNHFTVNVIKDHKVVDKIRL